MDLKQGDPKNPKWFWSVLQHLSLASHKNMKLLSLAPEHWCLEDDSCPFDMAS